MNNWNHRYLAGVRLVLGGAAIAGALTTLGCSSEKPFAKINGVAIPEEDYVHALERQNVVLPGGQVITAERAVIDQLISNQVILAEAVKINAVPSEDEVNRYYDIQKKIFENQYPGKNYEDSMKEQGTTPKDIKTDMKSQLAETNLFAKKFNVENKEIKEAFDKSKGNVLPSRVQLRLILVAPGSPDFQKAQQLLTGKTAFDEVAKQVNPSQLRATAGLYPQAIPTASLSGLVGPDYQTKIEKSPEGATFGPIDFRLAANQLPVKAWVKVEKRLPAFDLSFDDAVPLIKKQLVAIKLQEPANQNIRNEVLNTKLSVKFEPTDPSYAAVWNVMKKNAEDSGVGRSAPAPAMTPTGNVLPGGNAPAAPAGKAP